MTHSTIPNDTGVAWVRIDGMSNAIARIAHAIADRTALRLAVGEQVLVGDRDSEWPAFVFVAAADGAGWMPGRHLSASIGPAVVQTPYDTTELPTEIDDVLEVLVEDVESGWPWCRAHSGREGWVPMKTLEITG